MCFSGKNWKKKIWKRKGAITLRRLRQEDCFKFEVILIYVTVSRPARATYQDSQNKKPESHVSRCSNHLEMPETGEELACDL